MKSSTHVTEKLLSFVLVQFYFSRLFLGDVEGLIGFGDCSSVAGESAAGTATSASANVAAIRNIVAAHAEIEIRHFVIEFPELPVQSLERLGAAFLRVIDLCAVLGQECLGVFSVSFRVSQYVRCFVGHFFRLFRLFGHLLSDVESSLDVGFLEPHRVFAEKCRALVETVGAIFQALERHVVEINASAHELQFVFDFFQRFFRRGDVARKIFRQVVEHVEILTPDGRACYESSHHVQIIDHLVELLTVNSGCTDFLYSRSFSDHEIRLVS